METLTITEAKNRFTELADRAAAEHDHFTVTRNGHPHVMVVSVTEWDELQETIAVLSDPQARADLAAATGKSISGVRTAYRPADVNTARHIIRAFGSPTIPVTPPEDGDHD